MLHLAILAAGLGAAVVWWLLKARWTLVTFKDPYWDLNEDNAFKTWLLDTDAVVIFGRDEDGMFYVLAIGCLNARMIQRKSAEMAKKREGAG